MQEKTGDPRGKTCHKVPRWIAAERSALCSANVVKHVFDFIRREPGEGAGILPDLEKLSHWADSPLFIFRDAEIPHVGLHTLWGQELDVGHIAEFAQGV